MGNRSRNDCLYPRPSNPNDLIPLFFNPALNATTTHCHSEEYSDEESQKCDPRREDSSLH
jgi:hypothetical protein